MEAERGNLWNLQFAEALSTICRGSICGGWPSLAVLRAGMIVFIVAHKTYLHNISHEGDLRLLVDLASGKHWVGNRMGTLFQARWHIVNDSCSCLPPHAGLRFAEALMRAHKLRTFPAICGPAFGRRSLRMKLIIEQLWNSTFHTFTMCHCTETARPFRTPNRPSLHDKSTRRWS